jgi:hypothetical protein
MALFFGATMPAAAQIRRTTLQAAPPEIDPATIEMPTLTFTPTPDIEGNYDKYFYFNRADTNFMTAYRDLRECDDYARGVAFHTSYAGAPYPYAGTMTGAIGGVIANVAVDLMFGSAERRRQRRINMLTCMRFKEYRVFGLPENLWERFNFEEGIRRVPENERQRLLQLQARVASGPAPTVGEVMQ